MVTMEISVREYEELCNDSLLLNCLRNAGVDNTEAWDIAIEEYHELKGEE